MTQSYELVDQLCAYDFVFHDIWLALFIFLIMLIMCM